MRRHRRTSRRRGRAGDRRRHLTTRNSEHDSTTPPTTPPHSHITARPVKYHSTHSPRCSNVPPRMKTSTRTRFSTQRSTLREMPTWTSTSTRTSATRYTKTQNHTVRTGHPTPTYTLACSAHERAAHVQRERNHPPPQLLCYCTHTSPSIVHCSSQSLDLKCACVPTQTNASTQTH